MTGAATILPPPPPEPPRDACMERLAPGFQWRLGLVLKDANDMLAKKGLAFRFQLFEGVRSDARQEWLFGSGRTYRGEWLTNARAAEYGWHFFGLAGDCVPRSLLADGSLGDWTWDVPPLVWLILFNAATNNGCTTGLHWTQVDADHVQPAGIRVSPSAKSRELYAEGGLPAVWAATGMEE